MPKIVKSGIVYSSGSTVPAANIPYTPPSGSSSSATTAKAALDELITKTETLESSITDFYHRCKDFWVSEGIIQDSNMTYEYDTSYDQLTNIALMCAKVNWTGAFKVGDSDKYFPYAVETPTSNESNVALYGNDIVKILPVYYATGHTPVINEGDSVVISNAAGAVGWVEVTMENMSFNRSSYVRIKALTDIDDGNTYTTYTLCMDFTYMGTIQHYAS